MKEAIEEMICAYEIALDSDSVIGPVRRKRIQRAKEVVLGMIDAQFKFTQKMAAGFGLAAIEERGVRDITVRDWYAGVALLGMLSSNRYPTDPKIKTACAAFTIADQMIEESNAAS